MVENILNKAHTLGSFMLFIAAFHGMLKFFDVIK
jgi:hypothetical protein